MQTTTSRPSSSGRGLTVLVALLTALAACLVITACGGSDSSSDSGGDQLSAEDYSTALEDIMVPLGEDLQAAGADATAAKTSDDVVAALGDSGDAVDLAIEKLSALAPPDEAVDVHDKLVSLLEGYGGSIDSASDAAQNEDQAGIQDFVTASTDFASELTALKADFDAAGVSTGG